MTSATGALTLLRFYLPGRGDRIGVRQGETVYDLSDQIGSLGAWLRGSKGRVPAAIAELKAAIPRAPASFPAATLENAPALDVRHWLPPVDRQEVWAAGVTYHREVAPGKEGDVYDRVYQADRPELFFKSRAAAVVGHRDRVGIRHDATRSIPEPELALLLNPALEIVGQMAGNDLGSRDIEGANPLYLSQAKSYTASCALGPGILLEPLAGDWPERAIQITVRRAGKVVFEGETHTDQIRRRPDELVDYLGRCLTFPDGAVLLTGTGAVPPESFGLAAEDLVAITVEGLDRLQNRVRVIRS